MQFSLYIYEGGTIWMETSILKSKGFILGAVPPRIKLNCVVHPSWVTVFLSFV